MRSNAKPDALATGTTTRALRGVGEGDALASSGIRASTPDGSVDVVVVEVLLTVEDVEWVVVVVLVIVDGIVELLLVDVVEKELEVGEAVPSLLSSSSLELSILPSAWAPVG